MKTTLQFFAIVFCAILFSGCGKAGDTPAVSDEQKLANLLSGNGNKVWKLNKVLVNGVDQTLTMDQKKYTKTYTINISVKTGGSFTNSGGDYGEWFVTGSRAFSEFITTIGGSQYQVDYIIRDVSESLLDIQYNKNGQTAREIYNGY